MRPGLFISFEGPDGSGKSVIINKVYEWLVNKVNNTDFQYTSVIKTREPGGLNSPLAEKIRNLVLNETELAIPAQTEALLFAASRSAHVIQTIQPNLNNNAIVLSDRYVDSSIVYQGYVRQLGVDNIWKINEFAMNNILPDLTILLMVDAEIGLKRIAENNRETNRLDKEGLEFHKQVQKYYQEIKDNDKNNRIVIVDANQSIEEVFSDVKNIIEKLIYARN